MDKKAFHLRIVPGPLNLHDIEHSIKNVPLDTQFETKKQD